MIYLDNSAYYRMRQELALASPGGRGEPFGDWRSLLRDVALRLTRRRRANGIVTLVVPAR